ncbi:TonB family protein [Nitrosovibrio sp. Nv17]|uniref:TonB family protein n=1 Tax=Nitrosovibrio sp. Nv17 TaxID=1855339 RepID=UPI00090885C5|nr:TonB family protein [Nitrosovibrio sp. Nv17]SFW17520.1 TonB family C-terminal domain-containing protein [Nitrosovibrio sp. Nv17]
MDRYNNNRAKRRTRPVLALLALAALIAASPLRAQQNESEIQAYSEEFDELYGERRFSEAETAARRALAAVEQRHGAFHPGTADMLDHLAKALTVQGWYVQALPLRERALEIREAAYGTDHRDVVLGLADVAMIHWTRGRQQEAEALLRRALAIGERVYGPDHPAIAMILENLGVVRIEQDAHEEGEFLTRRALAIRREKSRHFGHDRLGMATSLNNLAASHDIQGRPAQAQPLYEEALALIEASPLDTDPSLTVILENLARTHITTGQPVKAEALIQRSLALGEKTPATNPLMLAMSLNRLGELRRFQGNDRQAEQAFVRALELLEKMKGTNWPLTARIARNLAGLYRAAHREQAAADVEARTGLKGSSLPDPLPNQPSPPSLLPARDDLGKVEAISQKVSEYPRSLQTRNGGKVMVKFRVTREGEVRNPVIMESVHPALEQSVVKDVLGWRFKPLLTVAGKPVTLEVYQPFRFHLDYGDHEDETAPFVLSGSMKTLPPEFQYDTPPVIKMVALAVYPFDLLDQGISGSARVSVLIDPEGAIRETKVLQATHPEFGLAAQAMMASWTFAPATKEGRPTWAILAKEHRFNRSHRDTEVILEAYARMKSADKRSDIHALSALDHPPRALYAPHPAYPYHLRRKGITGTVLAEFYIDEDGAVQLPRLVEAANPELGWAALTALSRWRFEPPLRGGRPVMARTRIPLEFSLE